MTDINNNNNNANMKRLRIDPTAFLSRNKTMTPDRSQKSHKNGNAATPTAAALLQIDDYSVSLFPQLHPILLRSCKPFLQLLSAGQLCDLQTGLMHLLSWTAIYG